MSLAVLRSRALAGMEAPAVSVEVHLASGFPGLTIVGLPDAEVREAKDRVRAALQNVGFEMPHAALPSTWRRPICPKNRAASICRLRSASWLHPGRFLPTSWTATNSRASCRFPDNCVRFAGRWR